MFMRVIRVYEGFEGLFMGFDLGIHDYDVLVYLVNIPEGSKMQISPKLE